MVKYKLLSLFLLSSIFSHDVCSKDVLILDVRTDQEWSNGYVEGATHQPVSKIDDNFQKLFPNKDQKIILYCAHKILVSSRELEELDRPKKYFQNSVTQI